MSPDLIIAQIRKIPEVETEAHWYIREYQESNKHPWEKFVNNLYLDFKIELLQFVEESEKQLLVGLTIII